MRLISQYRLYEGPCLQEEKLMVLATGQTQTLQKGYWASPFRHGDVNEWEYREAIDHWQGRFRGLTEGEDPRWRLSSYDTDEAAVQHGWTDDEKARFEEVLRTSEAAGVDYIIVEKALSALPYPAYAKHRKIVGKRTVEHALKDILAAVEAAGVDPDAVVAYERDHLDAHSGAIIDAVTATKDEVAEEDVVAA